MDDDAEFLRRYAGSPQRIRFMLDFHAPAPEATHARERLATLTKTTP